MNTIAGRRFKAALLYGFAGLLAVSIAGYFYAHGFELDRLEVPDAQSQPADLRFLQAAPSESRGKILAVVTSTDRLGTTDKRTGFELTELSRAYYVFRANGYDVDIASPQGGEPPMKVDDELVAADYAFLNDADAMAKVRQSLPISSVDPDEYAAVYLVGGKGTMFDRSRTKEGLYSRDLIARLATQLRAVQDGMDDVHLRAPVEVALVVQPTMEGSVDAAAMKHWCEQLHSMYRSWAELRRMQTTEVSTRSGSILTVAGFGAARVLFDEAGLHVLEADPHQEGSMRTAARVKVVTVPTHVADDRRRAKRLIALMEEATASSIVVRRYRLGDSGLVRDAKRNWRTGRTDLVLAGNFDVMGAWG